MPKAILAHRSCVTNTSVGGSAQKADKSIVYSSGGNGKPHVLTSLGVHCSTGGPLDRSQ